MDKRMIIKIGGLLLCVFFFVAPLVQCSQDSSLSATGLQISTGSGNLMGQANKSYPVVFVLLVIPVILVIIGFANKPFSTLRNISIGGLAAQIIFMIGAYSMLNSGEYSGGFVLTMFNWLILAIYIGLIILIQHCIKQEIGITSTFSDDNGSEKNMDKPFSFDYDVIKNVNLRSEPNFNSKVFLTLDKGDEIFCLEKGEEATFETITAPWFKVRNKAGIIGWCFSGHLSKK